MTAGDDILPDTYSRIVTCSPTPISPTFDQKVAFRLLIENDIWPLK